jgi:hypothetical protein
VKQRLVALNSTYYQPLDVSEDLVRTTLSKNVKDISSEIVKAVMKEHNKIS